MRVSVLVCFLALAPLAVAQVNVGGEPAEWHGLSLDRAMVPVIDLGGLEEVPAPVHGEFRYGTQRFNTVNVLLAGMWSGLPNGEEICRVALRSPGAVMLSVQFDRWDLGEGDTVFLYNAARTHFIGGFTNANRGFDGTMATAVLPGDEVVIEYHTSDRQHRALLVVGSLTHGFMDIFHFADADEDRDYDPGYQSAVCQINIVCPEAANWQTQKRSVAMFLRPDGNGCTGNLLNNTQTPGRNFFHLANHCYTATTSQWVFYFNYESPTCVGSTGPTTTTMTGAILRASYYYTDMCLLELTSAPPAAYNVYYAGWDRSGAVPQTTVTIEHPMYDVKKVAFNNDPSTSVIGENNIPCWRGNWDAGLVQSVSSGSPLFDQNKRMVGHMYDGSQVCSTATSVPTDCAKFSAGWDGTAASTRMRDWLDPGNTVMQLNGYDPNNASPTVAVRVKTFLEGPYNTSTTQMNTTLRSSGLVPMNEPYAGLGYTHTGGGGGEITNSSVLNVTGTNAVVDWVVLELRNSGNSSQVVATRSALLQADGDVVAASDGTSAVAFNISSGSYFIAVRHRNHLGIMTSGTVALTSTAVNIDLSNGTVALYGGSNAIKAIGARNVLYAGDVDRNGILKYTGASNDRDAILVRVGGSIPTNTVNGYYGEDVNMDGVVRYVGSSNDRDPILVNVGGAVPTATRNAQLP